MKIAYQIAGTSSFNLNGQRVKSLPEDWTTYDESKAYASWQRDEMEVLILKIPLQRMSSSAIDIRKTLGRRLSARQGLAKVALGFILNALQQATTYRRRLRRCCGYSATPRDTEPDGSAADTVEDDFD